MDSHFARQKTECPILYGCSNAEKKTEDVTLMMDGERRYGNILFEICYELLRTGKPGRPRKSLKKGVKVRLKNKRTQRGLGRKRPKYQAPHTEHPETVQDIEESDIHANHVEALNAALTSYGFFATLYNDIAQPDRFPLSPSE
jgi:hypothetical protein